MPTKTPPLLLLVLLVMGCGGGLQPGATVDGGTDGTSPSADAAPRGDACACSYDDSRNITLSWDCYCAAYDCTDELDAYKLASPAPHGVGREAGAKWLP